MQDNINGILCLDKPKGITSFSAVNTVRKSLCVSKAGHTGTLDPNATGVLPILVGSAVKIAEYLVEHDKSYTAELVLGKSTDSGDITGNVIKEFSGELPCFSEIKKAAESFLGGYEQVPPMYSALKVGGVKLVDAARKGVEIERKPRKIEISDISAFEKDGKIYVNVNCSKGTYIRTLCEDIGKKLGVPSCMGDLRRTKVGVFDISECVTLESLTSADLSKITDKIIPIDNVLDFKKVEIPDFFATLIKNGCAVDTRKITKQNFSENENLLLYNNGVLFATGETLITPDRLLAIKHKKML